MGLAIELGQRGVRCTVVERYPQPQPIPNGQNLTTRTMEHFHAWGAEKQLRAARTIPPDYGIGGLTAYGTLLGQYAYDWFPRDLVKPYYSQANERLPQYATEAVLRQRASELAPVQTMYGWDAGDVRQDEGGVSVAVTNRADKSQRISCTSCWPATPTRLSTTSCTRRWRATGSSSAGSTSEPPGSFMRPCRRAPRPTTSTSRPTCTKA